MIIKLIRQLRATTMKVIKAKDRYVLFRSQTRSLYPISEKFGFDRGAPIDRYYIESFLESHSEKIKGVGLEVVDDTYLKKFGGNKMTRNDILDMLPENKQATIYGNLKDVPMIKSNIYDCIVLTQVLGMVDDYEAAIRECHRILKPGGALLMTSAVLGPFWNLEYNFWRFTRVSMNYILGKYFDPAKVKVKTYGNVLVAQAYVVGLSREELTMEELNYNDEHFPILVTSLAVK